MSKEKNYLIKWIRSCNEEDLNRQYNKVSFLTKLATLTKDTRSLRVLVSKNALVHLIDKCLTTDEPAILLLLIKIFSNIYCLYPSINLNDYEEFLNLIVNSMDPSITSSHSLIKRCSRILSTYLKLVLKSNSQTPHISMNTSALSNVLERIHSHHQSFSYANLKEKEFWSFWLNIHTLTRRCMDFGLFPIGNDHIFKQLMFYSSINNQISLVPNTQYDRSSPIPNTRSNKSLKSNLLIAILLLLQSILSKMLMNSKRHEKKLDMFYQNLLQSNCLSTIKDCYLETTTDLFDSIQSIIDHSLILHGNLSDQLKTGHLLNDHRTILQIATQIAIKILILIGLSNTPLLFNTIIHEFPTKTHRNRVFNVVFLMLNQFISTFAIQCHSKQFKQSIKTNQSGLIDKWPTFVVLSDISMLILEAIHKLVDNKPLNRSIFKFITSKSLFNTLITIISTNCMEFSCRINAIFILHAYIEDSELYSFSSSFIFKALIKFISSSSKFTNQHTDSSYKDKIENAISKSIELIGRIIHLQSYGQLLSNRKFYGTLLDFMVSNQFSALSKSKLFVCQLFLFVLAPQSRYLTSLIQSEFVFILQSLLTYRYSINQFKNRSKLFKNIQLNNQQEISSMQINSMLKTLMKSFVSSFSSVCYNSLYKIIDTNSSTNDSSLINRSHLFFSISCYFLNDCEYMNHFNSHKAISHQLLALTIKHCLDCINQLNTTSTDDQSLPINKTTLSLICLFINQVVLSISSSPSPPTLPHNDISNNISIAVIPHSIELTFSDHSNMMVNLDQLLEISNVFQRIFTNSQKNNHQRCSMMFDEQINNRFHLDFMQKHSFDFLLMVLKHNTCLEDFLEDHDYANLSIFDSIVELVIFDHLYVSNQQVSKKINHSIGLVIMAYNYMYLYKNQDMKRDLLEKMYYLQNITYLFDSKLKYLLVRCIISTNDCNILETFHFLQESSNLSLQPTDPMALNHQFLLKDLIVC